MKNKYNIEYANSRELLEHNISVYEMRIRDWDGCSCELTKMKERLVQLQETLNELLVSNES